MRLKEIRAELKYSFGEMAQILNVHKGVYQGYENGRRPTPPVVLRSAEQALQRDREFMQRYVPGGEFDREITEKYPNGIMSEIPMECHW